jgi:hypothetical protein
MIELVVARYNENLNWLRNVPPQITVSVYDKHPDAPHDGEMRLPNIGREAHTYLHHIITNYHRLADVTVFCQGKPFDHAFDFHKTLRALAGNELKVDDFRWLGHIIDTDTRDGVLFQEWSKNEDGRLLDLNGFHRALFNSDGPDEYPFVLGAQFVATRELIHSRPLSFWQQAQDVSVTFPDAAHCFERTWDKVLGVTGIDTAWLAGRKTVYLKPIKRLQDQTV